VITSILCALMSVFIFTGGVTAALPIAQVLINGDTMETWVGRKVAETRLGITLADTPERVQVVRVKHGRAGAKMGLEAGQVLAADRKGSGEWISRYAFSDTPPPEVPPETKWGIPFYWQIARWVGTWLPTHPVAAIASLFGIIAGTAIIGNIIRFFQEYLSDKSAISAVNDIRRKLYDHVLHLPLSFFGSRGTSDITSRLVQDAQGLQDGFKTVLGQAIAEPIKASAAFLLAVLIDWRLTMFIIVAAPLMALTIKKFGKKMRRASRAALQSSATMLGQIESSLAGIRVVKGHRAERFERRRYARIMQGLRGEQLKMARYEAYSTPAMELLAMIAVGCVLVFASYLVLVHKTLQPGEFIVVMGCLASIGESGRRLSKINNVLQRSNAAAARVFEALDLAAERPSRIGLPAGSRGIPLTPLQREIRFENVSFTYPGSSSPALSRIHLSVPKGKCVAIVGRNGSGKTTLLALLPRFYDPDQGRVTLDGVDIRTATLPSLRAQIGIVTQESVIFPGSIHDNIAYGNPLATREQVIDAARRAFAHEFILEKPQDYDTPLDGLGGQLSGGQKQRICIARAILRDAPILILDEATSQVDAESEHLIQQALDKLMHERTTFVIAHRFSTILAADFIVVMDRGQIVGLGRHDELMHTCPVYRGLYGRQLGQPMDLAYSESPLPAGPGDHSPRMVQ
jgi:ABC-type multidrug transport system fused ATPase/permease subunit